MKTKYYLVKVEEMLSISDKAYKAVCFDGSEAIIPKSQVMGEDYESEKSDAYWISEWILKKKDLQYSKKRIAWFNEKGQKVSGVTYQYHTPDKKDAGDVNYDEELFN